MSESAFSSSLCHRQIVQYLDLAIDVQLGLIEQMDLAQQPTEGCANVGWQTQQMVPSLGSLLKGDSIGKTELWVSENWFFISA